LRDTSAAGRRQLLKFLGFLLIKTERVRMKRRAYVAASAALALAIVGCGENPSEPTETDVSATPAASGSIEARDPCAFATKEEVSAATGETIVQTQSDGERCTYQTEDAMAASVELELKLTGGAEEMRVARSAAGVLADMGEQMKGAGGAKGELGSTLTSGGAAPRLGDSAFFGPNEQLHVLDGDVYVAVTPPTMRSRMTGGNPMLKAEDKRKMAIAIAERVLSRL
jgi:hypothetical protein